MHNEQTLGKRIRQFLRDFMGSRLAETLDYQLLKTQALMEQQRQDFLGIISELRLTNAQLVARIAMYDSRAGLVPLNHKPGKPSFGADFSVPLPESKWQVIQREHDAKIAKELAEEAEAEAKKKAV